MIPELTQQELAAIRKASEAAAALAPKMAELLTVYERVRPTLQRIAQAARQADEHQARQRTIGAFAARGLCLAPSMPTELAQQIVRGHEEDKQVDAFVLGFYRRNSWAQLANILERWESNRFFRRRMCIYRDALWAHVNRRYTLSVRTLTPDVEGLVLDWLFEFSNRDTQFVKRMLKKRGKHSSHGGDSKYDANVVSRTIGQLAANTLTRDSWLSMFTLVEFANRFLYRGYKIELEHQKFLGKTALARHPMLHGSGLGSGTALNSLRLFLALDVLSLVE